MAHITGLERARLIIGRVHRGDRHRRHQAAEPTRQAVVDHYSWQRHVARLWSFARELPRPDGVRRIATGDAYKDQVQHQWNNNPVGFETARTAQPQSLEALARGSGGRFTGGAAAVDVKGTYDELGSRTGQRKKTIEVSAAAAGGGLAFVLAGGLLSGLWFRRIP